MCTAGFAERHALRVPSDVLRVPRLTPDDEWWKQWLNAAGVAVPAEPAPGIRLDSQATEGQAASRWTIRPPVPVSYVDWRASTAPDAMISGSGTVSTSA